MNAAARHAGVGILFVIVVACQGAQLASPSPSLPTSPPGTSSAPTPAATPSPTFSPTSLPTSVLTPLPSSEPTPLPTAPVTAAPTPLLPSPTVPATAEPTPPLPSPTVPATAEPTPEASGLVIEWEPTAGDPGFGRPFDDNQTATFHSGAVFANRYFIAGALEDEDFNQDRGLWSSADGLSWQREDLPNMNEVYQTAANAAGLLVYGDGLWLTTDGTNWEAVIVSDRPEQFISGIGATSAGFVGIGTGVFTSADGRNWQPVATESAAAIAAAGVSKIVSYGDRLVALTGGGDSPFCCGPLQVWTSTNLMDWTRVATVPGTRRVFSPGLAGGPLGWILAGSDYDNDRDFMWSSADGLTWQEVSNPIGPISDVFADDAGFVAVGFLFIGTGCALDPSQIQGLTWTSTDGRSWTPMPLEEFLHKRIDHLFRDGRTLIGIGLAYPEDGATPSGSVWTARLPAVAPQGPGPTPAPTPTPDPGGCGPG